MIWFTYRQHRMELMIAGGLLVLFAAIMIPTGLHMASVYQNLGLPTCSGYQSQRCSYALAGFYRSVGGTFGLLGWVNLIPLALGILLASPFVQDLESGTYRLGWTQSVPRSTWVLIKIALIAAACVPAGLLLSALLTWWRLPLDHVVGRLDPNDGFDLEGMVPVTYVLFAAALVLAGGTLMRRIIPAVGIALIVFVAVRVGVQTEVRPHYLSPHTLLAPAQAFGPDASAPQGAWVLGSGLADAQGRHLGDSVSLQICSGSMQTSNKQAATERSALAACMTRHHIFTYVTYQPANRFWLFQGIETGLYLVLSALLLALSAWWVRFKVA